MDKYVHMYFEFSKFFFSANLDLQMVSSSPPYIVLSTEAVYADIPYHYLWVPTGMPDWK